MDQEQVLKHLQAALGSLGRAQEFALTGTELWLTCGRLYGQVHAVTTLLADYTLLLKILDQPSKECIG
jgi:hypothetical protein